MRRLADEGRAALCYLDYDGKETTMDNIQVLLTLILIRLIVPIGILILIGEWERTREANLRNEHLKDSILQSSIPLRYTLRHS
jgi:hypothetical protein